MKVFIILMVLVLLYVIGQVLMLRPNPREQALMLLREAARRLGLQPRLVPPPSWLQQPVAGRLVACYILLVEEGGSLPYWRAERDAQGRWQTKSGDAGVLAKLSLPAEAEALIALETRANAASLYWQEGLKPEALPALAQLLKDLIKHAA